MCTVIEKFVVIVTFWRVYPDNVNTSKCTLNISCHVYVAMIESIFTIFVIITCNLTRIFTKLYIGNIIHPKIHPFNEGITPINLNNACNFHKRKQDAMIQPSAELGMLIFMDYSIVAKG